MKVLIMVNDSNSLYSFRYELIQRLIEKKYDVYLSLPYGERVPLFLELGCKYYETNYNRHSINPFQDLTLLKKYRRMIKEINPDIIFSFTIKPNIYGSIAARKNKIPIVTNITGLGPSVEKSSLLKHIVICLYKFAFKEVKKVFFQNNENEKFFEDNKIATNRHSMLPGSGVNIDKFYPLPYPNEKNLEFVFMSRIIKEKGIDLYIGAAKIIKQRYPNSIFHVCGICSPKYRKIINLSNKSGLINYHGQIPDVRVILEKACCLIHPTIYPEGMSNVVLEACACARPVITTNISGCKEIITNNENGYLMTNYSIDNLVSLIEKFINNPNKEKMGLLGRKKVEEKFNREVVVEEYLKEIYTLK